VGKTNPEDVLLQLNPKSSQVDTGLNHLMLLITDPKFTLQLVTSELDHQFSFIFLFLQIIQTFPKR